MLRLLPLALLAALLLPAAASADRVGIEGGTLVVATEPGSALAVASMTTVPCQFNLRDFTTGRQTPSPDFGPCLLFNAGDVPVHAGAGCTAVPRDDAVCPLGGVQRVAIRGSEGPDFVRLVGQLQEFAFGHYYSLGTDIPVRVPVPLDVQLGGGDDVIWVPESSGILPEALACGAGVDRVLAPEKAVWGFDCETGYKPSDLWKPGQPVAPPKPEEGPYNGTVTRAGDTLSYRATGEERVRMAWVANYRGRPTVMLDGVATAGPECYLDGRAACSLVGLRTIDVIGQRTVGAGLSTSVLRGSDPVPVTGIAINGDFGSGRDEIDLVDGLGGRISCGGGIDVVQADAGDRIEGDCERVKGGKALPGDDLKVPRTGAWMRTPRHYPVHRMNLRVACPATAKDDSCGGKLEAYYGRSYLGTSTYAIGRGKAATILFGFGVGEGQRGQSNLGIEFARMRRDIQRGRGAKLTVVLKAGGSRYRHRLTLTRIVHRG